MTRAEINTKVEEYREWEALLEEAKAMTDSLREDLKAVLEEEETEELDTGKYIIRYTSCTSNRFDTTAFKKLYADLYKSYTKQVASRRFSIAC